MEQQSRLHTSYSSHHDRRVAASDGITRRAALPRPNSDSGRRIAAYSPAVQSERIESGAELTAAAVVDAGAQRTALPADLSSYSKPDHYGRLGTGHAAPVFALAGEGPRNFPQHGDPRARQTDVRRLDSSSSWVRHLCFMG